ncbi:MAG: hypothetical protein POG74_06560 [Acidocella sp.]|nr:hypothetical protein [Acidocella sp.]
MRKISAATALRHAKFIGAQRGQRTDPAGQATSLAGLSIRYFAIIAAATHVIAAVSAITHTVWLDLASDGRLVTVTLRLYLPVRGPELSPHATHSAARSRKKFY